ncbi:metallophosphoesterase family protein [Myroides marinus]|uniref:metallophosphoesterase family protein n=1 Tax=Myroides marinus TaxID=703342 RepID=UPI002574C624|nr:metallophosphoesterase family protein [Myroides marinus]MDM1367937.1 metallophosphoesterase family protein [Myroides marinus]MDM1377599.1 metallophosphoesterase family protein [Myroides marinus]MDM1382510.1 metallophosphoesterase family protein [Myroides marinus]MDM1384721.1 metallophosphoesterase family protein [Myroides marinus]MDM1392083.1 metallophosphoesterase family protein [Myroides marinus]
MKKILLLSDTHGCIDESILKYVCQADEVWHAGDIGDLTVTDTIKAIKPLRGVYGNIDGTEARLEFPEELIFDCEGMKVYMIHIGGYPGKYRTVVKDRISREKPNIYICGHSHILKVQYDQMMGTLHLNPGAAGISGFHQVRTMLRFTIDNGNIKDMEVIEWPKNKKAELT